MLLDYRCGPVDPGRVCPARQIQARAEPALLDERPGEPVNEIAWYSDMRPLGASGHRDQIIWGCAADSLVPQRLQSAEALRYASMPLKGWPLFPRQGFPWKQAMQRVYEPACANVVIARPGR